MSRALSRLLRVLTLVIVVALTVTNGTVSALSADQKQVFEQGIYYYDTDPTQCNGSGQSQAVNSSLPTGTNDQIDSTLVLGFSDSSPSDADALKSFVGKHPYIGGVFFHGAVDSQAFNAAYFTALQKIAKVPLLITSDDEGGPIHRFLDNQPAAGTLGQGTASTAKLTGQDVGTKLSAIGVNTLLAPVLDTYYKDNTQNSDNKWGPGPGNSRSFGTTGGPDHGSANIIDKAGAFASGVHSAGLGVVYKHFPGIGQITSDTDAGSSGLGSAANPLSLKNLTDDLAPYKSLANKYNGAIMLSHVHVKEWDGGNLPVSESSDAVSYIRAQTGISFNGLIVSDDLGVPLNDGNVSNASEVARALSAGVNMPLITPAGDPDTFVSNVEQTVTNNPQAMTGVKNSQDKIASYKSQVTNTGVTVANNTLGQGTATSSGSCACNLQSSTGASGAGADHVPQTFTFLTGQGLSAVQASAIIGNLQEESGSLKLDPTGNEGGPNSPPMTPGVGYGIAQWTDASRQQGLLDYAKVHNGSYKDFNIQLGFFWKEATGPYADVLARLKKITDVNAATEEWMGTPASPGYENPGDPRLDVRQADARKVLADATSGKLTAGTPSSGSAGCSSNAGFTASAGRDAAIIDCPSDSAIICTRTIYYSQYDGPWSGLTFDPGCGTVGSCGCGLTSAAMAIATLTNDPGVTPATLLPIWKSAGLATAGGTGWSVSGWKSVGDHYNIHIANLTAHGVGMTDAEIQRIVDAVKGGALVGVSGQGSTPFTSGGHFFLIRGYDTKTDKFLINDPNNNLSSLTTTKQEWGRDILRQYGQSAWTFTK